MTSIQPYIEALQSKWWRLNNLYHIRDKDGNLRLLVPNHAQALIHAYELRYFRLLILKSRQQGVSTYKVADQLDDCLNIPGISTGIQSYGKTESKKLRDKAMLMYNMLDPTYLQLLGVRLVSANSEVLEFSNGSILRIGNFRGDTLQRFHVSELAKISSKYPDKAREIQTGAFEAVSKDSRITVETTAEGDRGLFPDLWKQAEAIQLSGQQLTELDFYPLFISWLSDPDCQLQVLQPPSDESREYCKRHNLVVQDLPEPSFSQYVKGVHYSDDPKASLTPYTITLQQASWLTSKMRALGEDFDREYPITPDTAFAVSVEGSYFRKQFEILHREGRIQPSLYRPSLPVYTSWDIGWNDEMVILFWLFFKVALAYLIPLSSSNKISKGFFKFQYTISFAIILGAFLSKNFELYAKYAPAIKSKQIVIKIIPA